MKAETSQVHTFFYIDTEFGGSSIICIPNTYCSKNKQIHYKVREKKFILVKKMFKGAALFTGNVYCINKNVSETRRKKYDIDKKKKKM